MPINWNKIIPRWGGDTIEPPEAKKDVGYIAGDKPPAKWENWLRKGTYEALDETRDVIEGIDSQLAQKASKTQEAWTTATLLNGWVNHTAGTYNSASYYKDEFGVVHLRGFIKGGTTTTGTIAFNLPVGYRPALSNAFSMFSRNSSDVFFAALVEVSPAGNVAFGVNVGNSLLTLDGIHFKVGA